MIEFAIAAFLWAIVAVLAVFAAFLALFLLVLPVGIFWIAFAEEWQRQEKAKESKK